MAKKITFTFCNFKFCHNRKKMLQYYGWHTALKRANREKGNGIETVKPFMLYANKHCKSWIPNPISWHCNCIFVEFFPLCLSKLLNYWKKSNLIQVNAAKRKLFKKNMLRRHFVKVSVLIVKSTSATHKIISISKYFKPYLSSQLNHRMRLHTRHLKCFVL